MGVTQAAGLSLKWFRDNFCAAEKEAAASMGVDAYDLINREAAQSPIGANKLLYAPYLMGERTRTWTRTAGACSSASAACISAGTCSGR